MPFVAGASRIGSHAVTRSVTALGDYPDTYANWVASVKKAGGTATALDGRPVAKYPASVWVPLVNAKKWPLPNTYSKDGQWAYYYAPADVAAVDLVTAKDREVKDLPWTDALAQSLKKIAGPALFGAGAVYLVGRMLGGSRR